MPAYTTPDKTALRAALTRSMPTKITLMYALPDEVSPRVSGCDGAPVIILKHLPCSPAEMTRLHHALGLDTMNDAQMKAVDEQYGLGAAYHFPYDLIEAAMPEALMDGDDKVTPYGIVTLGPREDEGLPVEAKENFTVEAKVVAVIVPKEPPVETPL